MTDFARQRTAIEKSRRLTVRERADDGLVRESFTLPREEARSTAKDWLQRFPKAAYWSRVESWQKLSGDRISFTMVRLPSAD